MALHGSLFSKGYTRLPAVHTTKSGSHRTPLPQAEKCVCHTVLPSGLSSDYITVQSTPTELGTEYASDRKWFTQLGGVVMDELKKSMH